MFINLQKRDTLDVRLECALKASLGGRFSIAERPDELRNHPRTKTERSQVLRGCCSQQRLSSSKAWNLPVKKTSSGFGNGSKTGNEEVGRVDRRSKTKWVMSSDYLIPRACLNPSSWSEDTRLRGGASEARMGS